MPSSWPAEALRAQAIAARSFALYKIRKYGLQPTCNCHLTDGSNDQVYIGWDKEGGLDGAAVGQGGPFDRRLDRDVPRSRGADGVHRVRRRAHRRPQRAMGNAAVGVPVPGRRLRSRRLHGRQPLDRLERASSPPGALTIALVPYTGDIGRGIGVRQHRLAGSPGASKMPSCAGPTGRLASPAASSDPRSRCPTIAYGSTPTRTWSARSGRSTTSLMCEPGLPTSTSKSLPGGARQTFQTGAIYRNGALDATVWLKGPVYEEYLVVGGAPGRLGLPIADPLNMGKLRGIHCPDGCSRADFEHGRIYWNGGIGAFALWGNVLVVLPRPGRSDRMRSVSRRPACRRTTTGRRRRRSSTARSRAASGGTCRTS